jgi:tRNA(Ile)-lysidine synthase
MIDPTDAAALAAAAPELARRAIRTWLRAQSPERHPPDVAAVDRVLAVARGDAVATEIGGGRRVARTGGRLRVDRPDGGPASSG